MREHNLHFDRLSSVGQAFLTLNDFFHGGKTALQKEEEELQRKAQELIDQTHPLANKDQYLVADTLDPFLRPAGAYPRTYGPPSPDTATPASNDKLNQPTGPEANAPKSSGAQNTSPKRMSVGHLPDPFKDGSASGGGMSYPEDNSAQSYANPPRGSMSFATEADRDAWMRNTGQLPIDISGFGSTRNPNQAPSNKDQTAIVPKQDPTHSSIVGYRKPEVTTPKTNQDNSWFNVGNFGRAANALQFMARHGGKAAARNLAGAGLRMLGAEVGVAALGVPGLTPLLTNPVTAVPVGLAAGWYYKDEIIAGGKALSNLITSGNQTTQPEFNSGGRVQEISPQEFDAGRESAITAKPEYRAPEHRVGLGLSLEAMSISKPASSQPAAVIQSPATWRETAIPAATPNKTTADEVKPLAISTPAAVRLASIANISTTFNPQPQEEPLPPFVPPYHIPNINLFQKCPIKLEARESMREDAKGAITEDMCPIFRNYSNQKLAQTLVDIACGIQFNPVFANVPKYVAGTFQHTHLMEVNKAYSEICGDYRFEAEIYYDSLGKSFDPKDQPRGSTKGMIRVDLRTTEPITQPNGKDLFEVYDLKTGVIGITEKQFENHIKNLPQDILYEVRPGGGTPQRKYHPVTGIDFN